MEAPRCRNKTFSWAEETWRNGVLKFGGQLAGHVPNEASLDAIFIFSPVKVLGFLVILSWIKFVEHELLIKMKNEKIISKIILDSLVPKKYSGEYNLWLQLLISSKFLVPSSSIHSAKPGLLHIPSPSCFQSYRSCTRNHHHQDQSLVAVCLSLTFGGFQSRYTQVIIQTIGDQWENAWDIHILGHLYPICWSSMTLQRTNNLEFETYVENGRAKLPHQTWQAGKIPALNGGFYIAGKIIEPNGFVWKCWVYSQWNSHLL